MSSATPVWSVAKARRLAAATGVSGCRQWPPASSHCASDARYDAPANDHDVDIFVCTPALSPPSVRTSSVLRLACVCMCVCGMLGVIDHTHSQPESHADKELVTETPKELSLYPTAR